MIFLEDPIYALSAIALLALALFGLYKIASNLKHKSFLERRDLTVLKVDPEAIGMPLDIFIHAIKPPFSFEVAVQHLGTEKVYYLVIPRGKGKRLGEVKGLKEVGDYHVFHSGGEHVGVYFKDSDNWPKVAFDKIDFSKVNEIGEGAVVQFVFGRRRRGKTAANLRVAVSAPSSFQAKEILGALKSSFGEYSAVDSKSEEFMHLINSREFDSDEKMLWQPVVS
ncbi:MAG: hypothetical protein Q8P99_02630 [bacterium]|nr:hypothetical protein [bacterium]